MKEVAIQPPWYRPRRLRSREPIRRLIREHQVTRDDLIYPMFVTEAGESREITSMPGIWRYNLSDLCRAVEEVVRLGIPGIILFGIPLQKDATGSRGYAEDGIIARALSTLRSQFGDALLLMADVCLCEYTAHGHCGVVENGEVVNDATVPLLVRAALCYAQAGADVVAPSDMMDGRVGAIREALDANGFTHVAIMAYSAKYASGFYGPFREAAGSTPQFGDRRSYQMDPANRREALREMALDVAESADIILVKPGMAYLDVLREARDHFDVPLAVYNVSGEYSMVKAAGACGWIDEERVIDEILTAFKRAGADFIVTYHALEYARRL